MYEIVKKECTIDSKQDLFISEVEKVVDSASLTRRKYLGNSDLAENFWRKSRYFLLNFGKLSIKSSFVQCNIFSQN